MRMPVTKGAVAQTVAFLALAGLLADTRRGLPGPEPHGRRTLAGAEAFGRNDELRSLVEKEVDAALAGMRGELEAARHEGARALANATATLGARVERLERDVDGLRTRGGAKRRRAQSQTTRPPRCDRTTFQARTDGAMAACCPAATGGHRRFL